jgi:uncharacterized protein (UPF0218 family)
MSTVSKAKVPVESSLIPNNKNVIRLLTAVLRKELRKPQGLLIEGPFEKTLKRLKDLIDKEKPPMIISVGDIVSRNMIEHGISPNLLIVDNKVMRKPVQPIKVDTDQVYQVDNPPGTISYEAWITIRRAIGQKGKTKVTVEGEEDLLTIVTVLSAPLDSLVVYGQPHVGIVVVKVTEKIKEKMRCIVDAMEKTSKS